MDGHEPQSLRQRPLEKSARIEADLFCEHCGYNLHSQPVVRDERLGILIVRCTECGRFQPAAVASSAGRVWLSRLATLVVAAWAIFVLTVVAWGTVGLAGLQVAPVELLTSSGYFAPDGTRLYRSWDPRLKKTVWLSETTDSAVPIVDPPYQRTWRGPGELFNEPIPAGFVCVLMALAPVVFGGIIATLIWHVPRSRYYFAALLPFVAAGFVIAIYHVDEAHRGGRTELVAKIVLAAAAVQMALMWIGTRAGRPVARFLVTLVVPPRPRQVLAFLWSVDGKTMPGATQSRPS